MVVEASRGSYRADVHSLNFFLPFSPPALLCSNSILLRTRAI